MSKEAQVGTQGIFWPLAFVLRKYPLQRPGWHQAGPQFEGPLSKVDREASNLGFMMVVVVIFALMCTFYYEYNYYVGELPSDNDDTHGECFSEGGESERRSIVSNGTIIDRF